VSLEPLHAEDKFLKPKLVRLGGWWGHRVSDRFVMHSTFTPEQGARGFRMSNPPVLLVSCLKASLSVFDEVTEENNYFGDMTVTDELFVCLFVVGLVVCFAFYRLALIVFVTSHCI
jgi:kynureninase